MRRLHGLIRHAGALLLMFAVQADGYAITTIEGIAPAPGELGTVQDAFCETHGMQSATARRR